MSVKRSPPWLREEIILALELYMLRGRIIPEDRDPDILALSRDLNRLPLVPSEKRAPNHRNPNGVCLKIANLRAFDPHAVSKGMYGGSRLDKELMEQFADDPVGLAMEARTIRLEYRDWLSPDISSVPAPVPIHHQPAVRLAAQVQPAWDTRFDPFALHLAMEQDMEAQNDRRQSAKVLACEICGFDFERTYGELGAGYIQFHHRVPLADLTEGSRPTANDLTPICANCHAMLHQGDRTLSTADLRSAIRESQRSSVRTLADRLNPPPT